MRSKYTNNTMLKKKQRLTKKQFDIIFSRGKRVHSPTLQLIYNKSDTFHGSAVVGKKVYKKAVDRNRLRRRLYGVLYMWQKEFGCTGTFVLIAKTPLKEVKKNEFTHHVRTLLDAVR